MTVVGSVMAVVALALWIAVVRHRARAGSVGALWWSCVCTAAIVTLKVGVVARPLNRITGAVHLDELVIHLLATTLFALMLSWAVRPDPESGTRRRALRLGITVGVSAFLTATWFLAPVYDMPDDGSWLPAVVLADPVMAVHWLGLHVYLLACSVALVLALRGRAVERQPGPARSALRLLSAATGLFALTGLAESAAQIGVLTGTPEPPWLVQAVNVVLVVVFAGFLLAVTIPLTARHRTGESLWSPARDGVA